LPESVESIESSESSSSARADASMRSLIRPKNVPAAAPTLLRGLSSSTTLMAPEMRTAAAAAHTPWIGVTSSIRIQTAAKTSTRSDV
jgi:hypothetical protein